MALNELDRAKMQQIGKNGGVLDVYTAARLASEGMIEHKGNMHFVLTDLGRATLAGRIVSHRRAALTAARGNQYYRDKSDRGNGTLCGAPCGVYDIPARARAEHWTNDNGAVVVPCEACEKVRKEQKTK